MKRFPTLLVAPAIVLALLGGFALFYRHSGVSIEGLGGIAPVGGVSAKRFLLSESPIYLQTDPRWKDQNLGTTRQSLGSIGCTLCAVSMALTEYGISIPPDRLNHLLTARSGFTKDGLIIWQKVSEVVDDKVAIDVLSTFTHATIDKALQNRQPVLAKVRIRGTIQHWVLLVGKDGQEYLMKDPLGDGHTIEKLSRYESPIYSIRIMQRS